MSSNLELRRLAGLCLDALRAVEAGGDDLELFYARITALKDRSPVEPVIHATYDPASGTFSMDFNLDDMDEGVQPEPLLTLEELNREAGGGNAEH